MWVCGASSVAHRTSRERAGEPKRRRAWGGAQRGGGLAVGFVVVTFIRSKAVGHTSSADPSIKVPLYITEQTLKYAENMTLLYGPLRALTARALTGGLGRSVESRSRRRGDKELLLQSQQPSADGLRVSHDRSERDAHCQYVTSCKSQRGCNVKLLASKLLNVQRCEACWPDFFSWPRPHL